ncbi:MAG: hypothetical protein FWG71_09725 [Synergistaceae bacterium]|nr:hypothetical protein [Synergistaceae bacterium]
MTALVTPAASAASAKLREVRVLIGKRSYFMQTELDDDTLNRVVDTVNEVCRGIGGNMDQDSLLMLTCLQLAYNLDKVSALLESLDGRLNDLKPSDVYK